MLLAMTRGKSTSMLALSGAALLGLGLLVAPATTAVAKESSVLGQDGGSLILVLDSSGSMKEPAGNGQTRMEAAKKGLNGVIDDLPDESDVGLRAYGSTIEDGEGSCKDSELMVPVQKVDKPALKAGVKKIKPLGNTPIAYALGKAYGDLPKEGPRSIVLVSDGEENCGGNPCKVARDLRKKGAEFYVDVVGMQVDDTSRNQLTCIASAGGGTYYDVKDIEELDSALTRTSSRAARGYEPAGIPVEGGTATADGAAVKDGQWLDTIGDSGEEFYELPDPGKGTLHVSASSPPSADSQATAERLELAVLTADGQECGPGAQNFVQGASNAGSPIVVGYSVTPELREECGKGPYVARVTAPTVQGVQPLELLVRSEPPAKAVDSLPGSTDAGSGFSDDTQGQPASGAAVPVVGGPNFSSAPPTVPGRYSDSILAGETLFYRVPEVGWGQQAVCDVGLGQTDQAAQELGDKGFFVASRARVFGALKSPVVDAGATTSSGQYKGSEAAALHVATPAVAYRNRESTQDAPRATALDGDFYCSVTVLPTSAASASDIGEIPLDLTVSIVGEVAGEPEYASEAQETANEAESVSASDDGGLGWPVIAGGVALLVLLLAVLLAVLRRRGGGAGGGEPPTAAA